MSVELEGYVRHDSGLFVPGPMLREEDHQGTFNVQKGYPSDRLFKFMEGAGFKILHGVPEAMPDCCNSPYSSESAFAIDPQRIDLEQLVAVGDLTSGELDKYQRTVASESRGPVDIKKVKSKILVDAANKFATEATPARKHQFEEWRSLNESDWLDSYAAYQILKEVDENAGKPWQQWEYGKDYSTGLVDDLKRTYEEQFTAKCYEQWIAEQQAILYRNTANKHGVELWGDVPFYTNDVWAHRDLFNLDAEGYQLSQGGVPEDGKPWQEWGTATYKVDLANPELMKKLVDLLVGRLVRAQRISGGKVRLDYFAGYGGAFELPMENVNKTGAPRGAALGQPVMKELVRILGKKPPFYVEDLGNIPPEACEILDDHKNYDFMGTKVALFLSQKFGKEGFLDFDHNPDKFPEHVVGFTSNHDTPSIATAIRDMRDKWNNGDRGPFNHVIFHLQKNFPHAGIHEGMSNAELTQYPVARVIRSRAAVAMVAIWDAIGKELQYNTPNTTGPHNWSETLSSDDLRNLERQRGRLLELNRASGRV